MGIINQVLHRAQAIGPVGEIRSGDGAGIGVIAVSWADVKRTAIIITTVEISAVEWATGIVGVSILGQVRPVRAIAATALAVAPLPTTIAAALATVARLGIERLVDSIVVLGELAGVSISRLRAILPIGLAASALAAALPITLTTTLTLTLTASSGLSGGILRELPLVTTLTACSTLTALALAALSLLALTRLTLALFALTWLVITLRKLIAALVAILSLALTLPLALALSLSVLTLAWLTLALATLSLLVVTLSKLFARLVGGLALAVRAALAITSTGGILVAAWLRALVGRLLAGVAELVAGRRFTHHLLA